MKSTVEKLSPTRVRINVEVPFTELEPEIDKAFKQLAKQILPELAPGAPEATAHDCSTNGLINHYKARRAALG